tara:strand:+ start:1185 stop:1463 length:279 start_codon:yes stop_codon:yes gene_type:complete
MPSFLISKTVRVKMKKSARRSSFVFRCSIYVFLLWARLAPYTAPAPTSSSIKPNGVGASGSVGWLKAAVEIRKTKAVNNKVFDIFMPTNLCK